MATDVRRVLRADGLLIIAGFREEEADGAAAAFDRELRASYELDNWTCLVLGDVSPR